MKKRTEACVLDEAINLLRTKRALELVLLRDQFHITFESLKPINLLKHTFREAATSTQIKEDMLNSVIGITTGYLSKAILIGASVNPLKKVLGALLQFTVATLVSKNPDSIKSVGRNILDKIFKATSKDDIIMLSDNGK
jgi:hypothetical protein